MSLYYKAKTRIDYLGERLVMFTTKNRLPAAIALTSALFGGCNEENPVQAPDQEVLTDNELVLENEFVTTTNKGKAISIHDFTDQELESLREPLARWVLAQDSLLYNASMELRDASGRLLILDGSIALEQVDTPLKELEYDRFCSLLRMCKLDLSSAISVLEEQSAVITPLEGDDRIALSFSEFGERLGLNPERCIDLISAWRNAPEYNSAAEIADFLNGCNEELRRIVEEMDRFLAEGSQEGDRSHICTSLKHLPALIKQIQEEASKLYIQTGDRVYAGGFGYTPHRPISESLLAFVSDNQAARVERLKSYNQRQEALERGFASPQVPVLVSDEELRAIVDRARATRDGPRR